MNGNRVWAGTVGSLLVLLMPVWLFSVAAVAHTAKSELVPDTFTQASLYQLASTWTTATKQQMHLGALRGKARVMVMYYTSCEYVCPILISQVKTIANALPARVRDNIGFVAVTFDPERDTPDVLKAYGDKMHLDPQSWTLLHGAPDDVLELAVLLGVKFKKDNQGGFSHSNLITVLNKEGEIVHRHVGLHAPIAETLAAIIRAAQE